MKDQKKSEKTKNAEQHSAPLIDAIIPTANEGDLKQILSELDRESAYREHHCWRQYITIAVSVAFCAFQLYATLSGAFTAQILRATHLAFVQLLCFLLFPATKRMPRNTLPFYDVLIGIAGASAWLYISFNFDSIARRAGMYTPLDIAVGIVGIIILFEACRRVVGLPIMLIAGCFIIYAFIGAYLPGFLNHRGYSFQRIVSHLFFNTEGIMGTPIGACASFIFLFILFGALLEKTGIGQFFIDICNAIAGGAAGGPAKVAVLTSALEGTVSGSSVSNTVGSGSFTIPMMKKLGYRPEFAAAVEASASTGGQLMPPIMGAAAFLMSESLGIPYLQVAKAAIIPALLYFAGIFIMVHLEAKKIGLKGMPRETLPRLLPLLVSRGYLVLPLAAIIFFLMTGKTPTFAALMGIVFSAGLGVVTSVVDVCRGKTPTFGLSDIIDTLCGAARNIISVAVACGMAGIIIGVVTLTGLGLKLGAGLVAISGGIKFVTLLFTMISSIILGMGAPTTANYLITSTITAGALIMLNVEPLAAHMFAFYFGIVADITPPVALAALAGAAIAKSKPMRTAVESTKLAIAAFIIPYMFVYNPAMLLINATPLSIAGIIITALFGMFCLGAGLEGYSIRKCGIAERILFLTAGLMLIAPELRTDLAGGALIVVLIVVQCIQNRREHKKMQIGVLD
ncbi:MAG: TRAP transporter permease [Bacteroides sp.]|nr:TRAP transporter permease [Prevotella sp.]MCM1406965.1 TRAP transporter permease [Treponema brennaborense]MCM1470116.1 TRAP transporter permease [Bacteroides sp.]